MQTRNKCSTIFIVWCATWVATLVATTVTKKLPSTMQILVTIFVFSQLIIIITNYDWVRLNCFSKTFACYEGQMAKYRLV